MSKHLLCPPLLVLLAALPATALDKVTLATNWKAEAEHGGFYQAIATGTNKRHGLDVTLRRGGPQVNNPQLLAAGVVDFNVGASSFAALNYAGRVVGEVAVPVPASRGPEFRESSAYLATCRQVSAKLAEAMA